MKKITAVFNKSGEIILGLWLLFSSVGIIFIVAAIFPHFMNLINPLLNNPPIPEDWLDNFLIPVLWPLLKIMPLWFFLSGIFIALWVALRGINIIRGESK